jgi:glutathione S-transferase
MTPTVYGADYSVYVRIVRLVLEEKGVAYRLEEVDIFAEDGPPAGYQIRHPFLKIPAFEHDGFRLYEAVAIARYVDGAFPGPALMPPTHRSRARSDQIIGILDSYAYRTWVWDIYVERTKAAPNEAKIAEALPRAETCLAAIEELMEGDVFFLGPEPSLADLHAAPMLDHLRRTPEGARLLADHPRWQGWWAEMSERPNMAVTEA